jgi:hypothetical protein
MTTGRGARGAAVAVLAIIALLGWGLPNVAGPALIEVRLVVAATVGPAAPQRTVVVGNGSPVTATSVRLAIRVTGRYFLPVTVSGGAEPLRVELRSHTPDGTSVLVWAVEGSAASLDGDADSPDGPSVSRAYAIDPGSIDLPLGPPGGVALLDGDGLPLDPGSYDLRAVAFGVSSGSLSLVIVD